ncbi:hypothetical protein DKX38_025908 [Salix brachista]|uniref:Apple domain-containing protein n=1 Tax=Salix brachista TaxID=2182728 RepID=A0A5N5JQT6_9ROSI|nr:hypothetical protein DKX38_025908 [Salix brachista]
MYWRFMTSQNGDVPSFAWIEKTQKWLLYETANTDHCDRYALCGANGFCNIQSSPVCACLNGFVPKSPADWDLTDWLNGCVRKTPLNCTGDGFRKLAGVKMPETKSMWYSNTMNLRECRNKCLEKCNCTAYSNLDIRNGGSGCMLWFGDLIDIRVFSENEQEIFIRMAGSELVFLCEVVDNGDGAKINKKSKAKKRIIISTVLSAGILLLGLAFAWRLFEEKRPLELAAESLLITCNLSEVLRSIHVGLLCVQENPEDRPNMSIVALMLRDDDTLPQPKQPGFFTERDLNEASYSSNPSKPYSVNDCSISELKPR